MGEAIGQILPLAVGVAISPVPIIGVVLMLVTPRARVNGPAFVVGWVLGLTIVGAALLLLAPDATDAGHSETWVNVLKLILGVLLVLMAARNWRGRPLDGETPPTPKWMGAIEGFDTAKAAGAGVLLSAVNPKNLLLAVAAGSTIAQATGSGGEQAVAYAVFVLIATIGVATPVAIYFFLGERAGAILDRLENWMASNNAVIMAVLLLVIGAKLIGEAMSGFAA